MRTLLIAFAAVLSAASLVSAQTTTTTAPAEVRSDQWRYVQHNGQWWYYTPKQTWLIHDGSAWQPYVATPAPVVQSAPVYQPQPAPTQYTSRQRSYSGTRRGGSSSNPNSQPHKDDPGLSQAATGNYPRYWLWRRLGANP